MFPQRLLPYATGIMLTAICVTANAQPVVSNRQTADSVFIDGRVLDETKAGLIGAIVALKVDTGYISGTSTNEEGYFRLYRPFDLQRDAIIQVSYQSYKTKEIPLRSSEKPHLIQMELNVISCFMTITEVKYRIPLIDPWGPTQRSFISEEIEKMAR